MIGLWAVFTWGGRIGLLVGDEATMAKVRIGLSLFVAAVAVVASAARATWLRPAVGVYSIATALVWSTSVFSVLGDPSSTLAFKLVHIALATVSIGIAVLAWVSVVNRPGSEPARPSGARSPADR